MFRRLSSQTVGRRSLVSAMALVVPLQSQYRYQGTYHHGTGEVQSTIISGLSSGFKLPDISGFLPNLGSHLGECKQVIDFLNENTDPTDSNFCCKLPFIPTDLMENFLISMGFVKGIGGFLEIPGKDSSVIKRSQGLLEQLSQPVIAETKVYFALINDRSHIAVDGSITDDEAFRSQIKEVCLKYGVRAHKPEAIALLCNNLVTYHVHGTCNAVISCLAKGFEFTKTSTEMGKIFDLATKFLSEETGSDSRHVFMSEDTLINHTNRRVEVDKFRQSGELKASIYKFLPEPITLVIGGPSGCGKTLSVLALANGPIEGNRYTIVSYTNANVGNMRNYLTTFEETYSSTAELQIEDAEPQTDDAKERKVVDGLRRAEAKKVRDMWAEKASKAAKDAGLLLTSYDKLRSERNQEMLNLLYGIAIETIPEAALDNIRNLPATDILTILLAMDEMGSFCQAVRAMCALSADELLAKMLKLPSNVKVRLAAIGTGVLYGQEPAGSDKRNYEVILGNMEGAKNEEIFYSFLPQPTTTDKIKFHPTVMEVVRQNSRMAALLGVILRKALSVIAGTVDERHKFLQNLDILPFLAQASIDFKYKNELVKLSYSELWKALVSAVRMHFLPHALTLRSKDIEIKYGLVYDVSEWDDRKRTMPDDAVSRYGLPSFSVILLAILTGSPLITKSAVSGAPFEEYAFACMFLLACASCGSEYFSLIHDVGVKPLNSHFIEGVNAEMFTTDVKLKLPEQECRQLVPFINDRTRFTDDTTDTDTDTPLTDNQVVDYFKPIFEELKKSLGVKKDNKCFVAGFRSPDKAPFADFIIIVDTVLYLYQAKDYKDSNPSNLALERWKMGKALDAETLEAYQKKYPKCTEKKHFLAPLVIETAVINMWRDATGVDISKVRRCIISPKPLKTKESKENTTDTSPSSKTKKKYNGWQKSIAVSVASKVKSDDLNVDLENVKFLNFDPDRKCGTTHMFTRLPAQYIVAAAPKALKAAAQTSTNI